MHYSYVSGWGLFYPFGLSILFLCTTCLDSKPMHFASKSVNFCMHHCITGLLRIK